MADSGVTGFVNSALDRVEKYAKLGFWPFLWYMLLSNREGRRAVREVGGLLGVKLKQGTLESSEELKRLREFGEDGKNNLLGNGLMATALIFLAGMGAICASALIPDPMQKGIAISFCVLMVSAVGYALCAIWAPLWAIVSFALKFGQKGGELEMSKEGLKKAPGWFFGSITAGVGEAGYQLYGLFRWFTRMIGWVMAGAMYVAAVPFHQAPYLLALFAVPAIGIFFAFNQGWEATPKDRGSVWKAMIIGTGLVLLNIAILASFPEINPSAFWVRVVLWTLIIGQIATVVRWSTAPAAGTAEGYYRAKSPGGSGGNTILAIAVLVIAAALFWGVVLRNEMDVKHRRPEAVVFNWVSRIFGGVNPQVYLEPDTKSFPGTTVYRGGFKLDPPIIEGDGHFPDTALRPHVLGNNPDSFLVAADARVGGWQLVTRTASRGDVIHYAILDSVYYFDDKEQGRVKIHVEGLRNDAGQLFYPVASPDAERFALSNRTHFGALSMRLGTGAAADMLYPEGYLDLTDRGIPVGDQQLMVGFNLNQTEPFIARASGKIRIIIWIERGQHA